VREKGNKKPESGFKKNRKRKKVVKFWFKNKNLTRGLSGTFFSPDFLRWRSGEKE
jgi:hypothetical protein